MRFLADFHIHSCLSPCASLEMSPVSIVQKAREVGLNAIALTDHNCAFNLPAFARICEANEMACLYGMEVTTTEEAHVLCLFDELDHAMEMGALVYDSLPDVPNQPERFGDQPIINADEEILGFAETFLISASGFDVTGLVEKTHELKGLCIPAHIDRSVYGMIAQLGFLPDEDFDAVELTAQGDENLAGHHSILRNSDAHALDALGSAHTEFELPELSIQALAASLRAN